MPARSSTGCPTPSGKRSTRSERRPEHGSLAAFFWHYEPPAAERPERMTKAALMKLSKPATSTRLSRPVVEKARRGLKPP